MATAIAVAMSALLLVPTVASAATGAISGTVTSSTSSAPIEFAEACAYVASNGNYGGCSSTDASGHYTIASLQPGSYKVQFTGGGADYAPQYYNDRATRSAADPVQVSSGATASSIDAALAPGAHIGGIVTEAAGGAPIEGTEVCATETGAEELERCAESGSDGGYLIEGLPAGFFRVAFTADDGELEPGVFGARNYVDQYWHAKATEAEAEPVAVGVGGTVGGIDAAMQEGGTIAGSVTDAGSHAGLEFAEVCAIEDGSSEPARCEETGQDGRYVIAGLPTAAYKVHFVPAYDDHTHAGQYYSGKLTLAAAESVSVTQGSTAGAIDAALLELGKVSGHVTAAGGGALAGISVCADPVDFEFGGGRCEVTDVSGDYTISGLQAGEYTIDFDGGLDHVSQYYDDQATFSKVDRITVSDGTTAGGIDAELAPAGRIAGRVTDAETHAALDDLEVCAHPSSSSFLTGDLCGFTNTSGEYTIGGLKGGSYQVYFESGYGEISPGHFGELNYLPQYYDGKEAASEATPVTVAVGSTAGSIDAALQHGAEVSGTVTAASGGAALEDVEVCVDDAGRTNCADTGSDGTYRLGGLPSGEYTVRFVAQGSQNYVRQFYKGKPTRKEADRVTLTAGQATGGIDAALQAGGSISGTVTDASSHAPIEGARVCVVGYEMPCGLSAANGGYVIAGLPSGSYKVRFDPYEAVGYLEQYYHGKASAGEAEAVSVVAGSPTAGIDAAMVPGGSISGTVTDVVSGLGAHLVEVCAFEAGSSEYGDCAETAADGTYTIHGIRTGSYEVRFSPGGEYSEGGEEPNRNYVTQYYDGKAQADEAGAVAVTDGDTTTGIDAVMHEGGRISGRVTAAGGGTAIEGAEVCTYTEGIGEAETRGCTFTDEDGEYAIEGLATGSYTVVFYPGFSPSEERNLLLQFYDGRSSAATADPVSVTAGATHANVNAALATGGQITGHVSDASTAAGIAGAEVCAIEAGGAGEFASCGQTNGLGNYTIPALSTGSYKVEFSDLRYEYLEEEEEPAPEELYVRQYWSNSPSVGSAEAVSVTAGAATGGINASLTRGSGASPGQHALSVGFAGTGSGAVSSSPAGISCSSNCAHDFAAGTEVTLTAVPAAGSTFTGWSGACTGTGPCRLKLAADVSVVAAFETQSSAGGGGSPGGGSGTPGGGSGPGAGASVSGAGVSTPGGGGGTTDTTRPSATPKPLHCKKGFVGKKLRGKDECVRRPRHRHAKRKDGH